MKLLTRWNPLQELDEAHRVLFGLTPGLFRRGNLTSGGEGAPAAEWFLFVDIVEDEKEYLIKVELPEVQKDDVKVTVENGTLTISGERKAETEQKGRKFIAWSGTTGGLSATSSFRMMPEGGEARAEYKDGVLRVHLAKSEKALPKQIEVKVN